MYVAGTFISSIEDSMDDEYQSVRWFNVIVTAYCFAYIIVVMLNYFVRSTSLRHIAVWLALVYPVRQIVYSVWLYNKIKRSENPVKKEKKDNDLGDSKN